MDKLDALVLANKVEVKSNVSDDVRKRTILKNLGIENEIGELTEEDRFAIDNALAGKKSTLDEIRNFQPEGGDFDFEAEYSALQEKRAADATQKEAEAKSLKDHNEKMFKPILDGFKEMKRTYKDEKGNEAEAKYVVDEKFATDFFNEGVEELTKQGFKITTENAQEVSDYITKEYIVRNFGSIVDSMARQISGKKEEEFHKEVHNDSPQNRAEAPGGGETKLPPTAREQMLNWNKK
jgi:hypothetical protein